MDMFSSHNLSYKLSSFSAEENASTGNTLSTIQDFSGLNNVVSSVCTHAETQKVKKRRGIPGNPGDKNIIFFTLFLSTYGFILRLYNFG